MIHPAFYLSPDARLGAGIFAVLVVVLLIIGWAMMRTADWLDRLRHPKREVLRALHDLSPDAISFTWRDRLTLSHRRAAEFLEPVVLGTPSDFQPTGFPISLMQIEAEGEFVRSFGAYLEHRGWPRPLHSLVESYRAEIASRKALLRLRRAQIAAVAALPPGSGSPALLPFAAEEGRLINEIAGYRAARAAAERTIRAQAEAEASAEAGREE